MKDFLTIKAVGKLRWEPLKRALSPWSSDRGEISPARQLLASGIHTDTVIKK
jgi:hypothetical protein